MTFDSKYKEHKDNFEKFLTKCVNDLNGSNERLLSSVKYSLLSGGKRIRPILMLFVYELCGGKSEEIYKFAVALEAVHTYSLIHDDLPCMDDDLTRRGKPSNHAVYGETIALLSGDALLAWAFELASSADLHELKAENILKSISVLSYAAGPKAMISGQCFDLNLPKNSLTHEKLIETYRLKTSALISAACEIGAILSDADSQKTIAAKNYGEKLGLCFQICDDVSDNESLNLSLLKNPLKIIDTLKISAETELNVFEGDTSFLKDFADFLTSRIF